MIIITTTTIIEIKIIIIIIIVITKIKIKEKKDLIRTVEWNKMISSFVILSSYSNVMTLTNQLKFSVNKSAYRSSSNTNLLITLSSFISYI